MTETIDELRRFHNAIIVSLMFIFILLAVIFYQLRFQNSQSMTAAEIGVERHAVNGINIPGCAYIVKTKGESIEEINNTDYHEACHEFIRRDYYHFCEEYYMEEEETSEKSLDTL